MTEIPEPTATPDAVTVGLVWDTEPVMGSRPGPFLVDVFVGVNGPRATNPGAIGISLQDTDFALAILKPSRHTKLTGALQRTYRPAAGRPALVVVISPDLRRDELRAVALRLRGPVAGALVWIDASSYGPKGTQRRAVPSVASMGLPAVAFGSAEAFLNSDSVEQTSCLVLDVHMPGMSGLKLQRHLAATGRQIPIVFISAYPDGEVCAEALESGAVCFLTKPFNERDLLAGLRAGLTSAHADLREHS